MTEFALIIPVLAMVLFGMVEAGFGWHDSLTVSNATRLSVRTVTNLGNHRQADYEGLLALQTAISNIEAADINHVIIYQADNADGSVPSLCMSGGPHSVPGLCNHYTGAELSSLNPNSFGGTTGCAIDALDRFLCPTSRQDSNIATLQHIGVWVEVTHRSVTGFMPLGTYNITDQAVMKVEPRPDLATI